MRMSCSSNGVARPSARTTTSANARIERSGNRQLLELLLSRHAPVSPRFVYAKADLPDQIDPMAVRGNAGLVPVSNPLLAESAD